MNMRKSITFLGLIFLAAAATGCVSQSQYRDLEQAYRNTLEQVAERDARIAELEQQMALLRQGPERDRALLAALQDENDQLRKRLEELQGELEELARRPTDFIVLSPEVDQALKNFAAQHPDLVEYDPTRGMVKFRSDLTFALGSADLTANARSTLNQLAQILNDAAAQQYEVRIIGHTDTVPISRPQTRQQHPTNWHLSAHRAISVKDALEGSGVRPVRMMIAGYGPYRPVAQNTRTGAEPNRRVELYLVGMTPINESYLQGVAGSVARPAPAAAPAPAAGQAEPTAEDRIPLK